MKTILLSLLAAATAIAGDVPSQPIAKKGALIFSDDFARPELGSKWRVTTPTFTIADGLIESMCISEDKPAFRR